MNNLMLKHITGSFFLSCLFCFLLPLSSGCSLLSSNNETVLPRLPAEWEYDREDFPQNFPTDSFTETGRDLDIAIIGEGFFRYADPFTGERLYSRRGHLSVNSDGMLVLGGAHTWHLVEPAISIPRSTQRVCIHDDGAVWILLSKNQPWQNIGRIELATFAYPDGLLQVDEHLYRETEASGHATIYIPGTDGTGLLKAQYLETKFVP